MQIKIQYRRPCESPVITDPITVDPNKTIYALLVQHKDALGLPDDWDLLIVSSSVRSGTALSVMRKLGDIAKEDATIFVSHRF